MAKPSALIVDNDPFYVELLADLLQREGYQILKAYDGLAALELLEGKSDVRIIIDRRQGERRKALQPVTEERRREDRRKGSHLLLI